MTNMTMSEIWAADDDARFAKQLQDARDAIKVLNRLWDEDLPELLAEERLEPEVMAQLLMEVLKVEGGMLPDQKTYWMRVGVHMGSDWINAFRRAGAFMAKVDEF